MTSLQFRHIVHNTSFTLKPDQSLSVLCVLSKSLKIESIYFEIIMGRKWHGLISPSAVIGSSSRNIQSLLSLRFLLQLVVLSTVDNIQDTRFRMDCPKIAFCGLVREVFKQKPATCGFFTTGAFTANPKRMTVTLESATHSYIALYPVIFELYAGPQCEFNHIKVRKYLTLSDFKYLRFLQ